MLQLQHYSFTLPFAYPFTIAKGTKTEQPTLIVSLGLAGKRGFGEASAIKYYGTDVASMATLLESKRVFIERYALTDLDRFWHFLHHLFPGNSFLIAALDMAAHDLFAKMRMTSVRQLLRLPLHNTVQTDYTIGSDTAQKMIAKVQAHPWPVYKIKITSADEIDILRSLRTATDAPFRIDANEALDFETVKNLLPEWKKLGVVLVEQPLPKTDDEAMEALCATSEIEIFADESCVAEEDVAKCAGKFHGINIKLAKCGGITPALRMVRQARSLGLKIMFGSMNESTVGTAATVCLAPLADALDADGPLLLAQDLAEGLQYADYTPQVLHAPGMGFRFWGEARDHQNFPATLS